MEWINADFASVSDGRRHIGAMRLVATRMEPDRDRPQEPTSFLREHVVKGVRFLREYGFYGRTERLFTFCREPQFWR